MSQHENPPRIYIAGPIHGSGTQASNMANALQAAEMLAESGCVPFVPHLWFPWEVLREMRGTNDQELWMRIDFAWLQQCHALVRLDGDSPGADREVAMARSRTIPVFKHDATGAAKGDAMTPVRLFLAELHTGRFDAHKREHEERKPVVQLVPHNPVSDLQIDIADWLERQPFGPGQQPWEPLVGMMEEMGELSHSHLKQHQGIRGDADKHEAEGRDSIGDLFIYMVGYCIRRDWSIDECIKKAWDEVSKRDWKANPGNGGSISA